MSGDFSQFQMFQTREQFRMRQLQVNNWGTFDNHHTIPIPEKGFLLVGRSGSGKTTLLDAISALLVPPKWVNFNAAAQENDRRNRDRNLATYVRGAWAEQKDDGSGEVTTKYLRTGTTWSAIALTYENTNGRVVTLVRMFWLRGAASTARDVKQHFMIFERGFDLQELSKFDLDLRRLKHELKDGHHFDQFSSYCERFRRLLEIHDELALRLLHKTQSAKNLGDLNTFLREFMLERPPTFDVAETLVNEFGELNDAHQSVVTARDQVAMLKPAHRDYERCEEVRVEREGLMELRDALDPYRKERREALLAERITALRTQAEGLAGDIRAREHTLSNHREALRDLEARHRELGGDRIETLKEERVALTKQREDRLRKRDKAQSACQALGWHAPATVESFTERVAQARQELNDWQERGDALREQQVELATQKRDAERDFGEKRREVEAMQRQPSNIPSRMLDLRASIAESLGLSEQALPFVGELLDVREDEAMWRGAIERVLHSFALSLLVDDRNYNALSKHVNEVHLGMRLVYFRTGQPAPVKEGVALNSLVRKLKLKDCAQRPWLLADLQQRFDYECVDSMRAFRQHAKALTCQGQVKHSQTRHEKDDRHAVDDPRNWVLGFDNRDKRALFEKHAQELAEQISHLERELRTMRDQERVRDERAMACRTLADLEWHEIDIAPLEDRLAAIENALREIREQNTALQELDTQLEAEAAIIKKLEGELRKQHVAALKVQDNIEAFQGELENLRGSRVEGEALTPDNRRALDGRFESLKQATTLENLDGQTRLVERAMSDEIQRHDQLRNQLVRAVEDRFAAFKRQWPLESSDVDATLASAGEFIAKLKRLESDGLPKYEKRFFELLQTQSHQNLAALNTHLQQALRDIRDRMEIVNESLRQAEFNPGTYLRIDVSDHHLPEVRDFKQQLKQALSHAFGDDRAVAEQRFLILRQLVERLKRSEAEDKRWRETVLDVRLHVEFIGREFDKDGREMEVYRSGAGKSGGQRQKLATTCLAAALRYQLGGAEQEVPVYAPVVLDEAFDKADNEFTQLAMRIFENFGFQMIVATPLKSVMTLEPFIGGACFVDISDRQRSTVLQIEYDEDRQRLNLPEQTRGDASTIGA